MSDTEEIARADKFTLRVNGDFIAAASVSVVAGGAGTTSIEVVRGVREGKGGPTFYFADKISEVEIALCTRGEEPFLVFEQCCRTLYSPGVWDAQEASFLCEKVKYTCPRLLGPRHIRRTEEDFGHAE